jgi:thiol:disulfide interchange protein DsbD
LIIAQMPYIHCMRTVKILWAGLALLAGACTALELPTANPTALASGHPTVVITPQVRAELVLHAPQGLLASTPDNPTVWLGLYLRHQPGWHSYWKNPGDSGLPTRLQWKLPTGWQTGEIAWPSPQALKLESLVNYGYEGSVLLSVPLYLPAQAVAYPQSIELQASWLVCRTECIPQEGSFHLNIQGPEPVGAHLPWFEAAWAKLPATFATQAELTLIGQALHLSLDQLPAAWVGKRLMLFPELPEVIDPSAAWTQSWSGPTWQGRWPLSPLRSTTPKELAVVLTLERDSQSLRAVLPIVGNWPQTPTPAVPVDATGLGFWGALLGAFLGGLILNLMPCVFPILTLKIFSLSGPLPVSQRRLQGLSYATGVLLSLLLLGGVLLWVRHAGGMLGWGFQLQQPAVVAGLACLFTLLGLNLMDVWHFRLGLPALISAHGSRHALAESFLTGILTVVVASPCTAPFMGAALGLALTLPDGRALLVFAALGLGLASPYVLASWVPALGQALPRPGAWMAQIKHLMAFPMWLTVVWLIWVLGQQNGMDGAGGLLAQLVLLSGLLWSFGLQGPLRSALLALFGGLWMAAVWFTFPWVWQEQPRTSLTQNAAPGWSAWSEADVQRMVQAGTPVFVDFTAAWCMTCQWVKQTTLSDATLLAAFRAQGVQLMRADWTRRDPQITSALQSLGRSGVPVYVLYLPQQAPVVLPELLKVEDVLKALRQ